MESKIAAEYPLHFCVWNNDLGQLVELLEAGPEPAELERKDPRGRTPLMLAVTLGRAECAGRLLSYGADATGENSAYWGVAHEAVASGDPQLLQMILQYRDYQRARSLKIATSKLLKKLKDTQDFYTEMRWEFTSWVPFVSRVCPSDTYKVYKSGSFVRIDTTLVGFDPSGQWERGNQSLIFKSSPDGKSLEMAVVDHEQQTVQMERFLTEEEDGASDSAELASCLPSEAEVSSRLTSPIVTTYVDIEKISFERVKAGLLWGGRDKEETVNGYVCKVYSASQVELVTKTRTEHLTERDRAEQENRHSTPMDSLLKFVQGSETRHEDKTPEGVDEINPFNPNGIAAADYFNPAVELGPGRDIGRPKQMTRRAQNFKAQISLAKDYPLDLEDQIAPIVDLMAANNTHFARLKNFIQLQLPAGFPVKIDIPLYHVINAKVTFGNIFGRESPVEHVQFLEGGGKEACAIDDSVFEIPAHYHGMERNFVPAPPRYFQGSAEDDVMLQWAIQQSLRQDNASELLDMEAALGIPPTHESDLDLALQLSLEDEAERERLVAAREEEELRLAIQLSMSDQPHPQQ